MFKKVVILPTILLFLLSMSALTVSANSSKTRSQARRVVSNNLIYAQVFHLIDGFEKEAEKTQDEQAKNYLKNYFAGEANLTEEQHQILKTIARNYTSVFYSVSYKQKLKLSAQYRNELKTLFGASEFNRFDNYVKTQIAPDLKIIKLDNGSIALGGGGTSGISLDESIHQLQGSSSTYFLTFDGNQALNCSVSASMSGPNVSVSNSDSNGCTANLSVTLLSSDYLPGSQYCVVGSHVVFSGTPTTSIACLTTPGVPRVVKVEFERIVTDDLAIDVNPNAQGGLRIFPDKKNPMDGENRRKIRVRAKHGANTSGVRIYFRNFDLDDPSANGAPIDVEPTLNAGDDNNGNVDGTMNTRAGLLSLPSPNPNNCQTFAKGVSCLTDSSGEAAADFTLTMQPGDNFTVAAGTDETYLSNLVLAADGINLKDAANIQTPVTTTANPNACNTSSVNACRADMLTVWRRLHIEVDSMGVVTGNKVEGTLQPRAKVSLGNQTLTINVPPTLEGNRFENGRMVIVSGGLGGGEIRSFRVVNSDITATPPVNANTSNTVTIINDTETFSISAGDTFTLYDDDDFDDLDGANLDGDTLPSPGEDVSEPDRTMLRSVDTPCPNSILASNCNVLASAYIRPLEDLTGNQGNVPFSSNVTDTYVDSLVQIYFQNKNTEASTDFWTIYLFGAYQHEEIQDSDPDESEALYGATGTLESTIYLELARAREYEDLDRIRMPGVDVWRNRSIGNKFTTVHEVGHLFGCHHFDGGTLTTDYGVMGLNTTRTSAIYNDYSIKIIREATNP